MVRARQRVGGGVLGSGSNLFLKRLLFLLIS